MRVEPNGFQVHLLNHSDTAADKYDVKINYWLLVIEQVTFCNKLFNVIHVIDIELVKYFIFLKYLSDTLLIVRYLSECMQVRNYGKNTKTQILKRLPQIIIFTKNKFDKISKNIPRYRPLYNVHQNIY